MGDGQSSPPLLPGSEGMGAMATSTQRDEDREQREQARAEKLEALHETLTAQVAELVDSEAWQTMLRAAARFHRYSFGNVCMILAQRPTATQVAGFHTWRSLGRSVTKGEKGIAILAPVTYKTKPTAEPHARPGRAARREAGRDRCTASARVQGRVRLQTVIPRFDEPTRCRRSASADRVSQGAGAGALPAIWRPLEPLPLVRRRPARAGRMRATRPAWAADVRATNRTPGPSLARHRS